MLSLIHKTHPFLTWAPNVRFQYYDNGNIFILACWPDGYIAIVFRFFCNQSDPFIAFTNNYLYAYDDKELLALQSSIPDCP